MNTQWEYLGPDPTEDSGIFSDPIDFWSKEAGRWRQKAIDLSAENFSLRAENERLVQLVADSQKQIEALKAKIKDLAHRLFGRKTEKGSPTANPPSDQKEPSDAEPSPDQVQQPSNGNSPSGDPSPATEKNPRPRGQQRGAPGHGRKKHPELEEEVITVDFPTDEKCCPHCGLPFGHFPGFEESTRIDWQVVLRRKVFRRPRYRKTCQCPNLPAIIAPPPPPNLIAKGMFTVDFIVKLLMLKFISAVPMNRIKDFLRMEGLHLSNGTLTGVLHEIHQFLEPLYDAIRARNAASDRLKGDETSWKIFLEVNGQSVHKWWLWVFISPDTVVFILNPSRSSKVPRHHLKLYQTNQEELTREKIIFLSDLLPVYGAINRDHVENAWCWSHVRRLVIDGARGYPLLADWRDQWVTRIGGMYALNDARLTQPLGSPEWDEAENRLRRYMEEEIHRAWQNELAGPDTHPVCTGVMETIQKRWPGLTLFLDHPEVPLDNNESERALRTPVCGRKNFYGSSSLCTGEVAAMMWTIAATAQKNGCNPLALLTALLNAYEANNGRPLKPSELARFFPWALSEADAKAWKINSS